MRTNLSTFGFIPMHSTSTRLRNPLAALATAVCTLAASMAMAATPVAPANAVAANPSTARVGGTGVPASQIPIQPHIGVALTTLAYEYATAAVGAPPNITIKIGSTASIAQLNNCMVTLKVGTTATNNFPVTSLPLSSGALAPKDGETISFKATSAGCAGEKSVVYKKPWVADPTLVGTFTGVTMGKTNYKDNENIGFTLLGNNGEAQCSAQLTVDGNYAMALFIHPFLPMLKFPQTRTDGAMYKAGWHKLSIVGHSSVYNGETFLACKGSASVDFKIDSSAPNAPKLTAVQAKFIAPNSGFKAGFPQEILVSGTGACKFRLVYAGVGPQAAYSWTSEIQSPPSLPVTLNVHNIATPGDYTVQAKPEGDCSGGGGAGFNVSLP
jgi:hypothetical protein